MFVVYAGNQKGKFCCNNKQVSELMTGEFSFLVKFNPKYLLSFICGIDQGENLENNTHKNITLKNCGGLDVFHSE